MYWGVLATAANDTQGLQSPGWLPGWVPEWIFPLAATLAVVVFSWAVARLLTRLLGRRIARRLERPSLTRTAIRGIRLAVYLLGFLTVLRIYGLDLGNIALSVTVFSAVVGVILAPIVGGVISGVFLLADQPYEIGDMVEISGSGDPTRGFVEDITLRYTKIFTLDNTFVVIPNGNMRERDVYNYSAEDTRTRQSLDVLVTYESDIEEAQRLIEQSAREVEGVVGGGPRIRVGAARYPASPDCLINSFADHGVLLTLRYWLQEPYHLQTVRSAVQENVWDALAGVDVQIAYPHSHLYFDETSGELPVAFREGEGPTGRVSDIPDEARTRQESDSSGGSSQRRRNSGEDTDQN